MTMALIALSLAACTSMRLAPCDKSSARAPRNFGQVTSDVYRGGQPATCGELQYLQSIGVRSVLKLNDRHLAIDADEERQARALGLQFRSFAFDATTIGQPNTCDSVGSALAFLRDPEHWPVYVHCSAGKDRTGYIIGLYERFALHQPIAAVMEELHRYGHRGIRSLLMTQIDEQLRSETPACRF